MRKHLGKSHHHQTESLCLRQPSNEIAPSVWFVPVKGFKRAMLIRFFNEEKPIQLRLKLGLSEQNHLDQKIGVGAELNRCWKISTAYRRHVLRLVNHQDRGVCLCHELLHEKKARNS